MNPPAKVIVVDTDVVSYIHAGKPQSARFLDALEGSVPAASFVTIGELLRGALNAGWSDRRTRSMLAEVARAYLILAYDLSVAEEWARLMHACRHQTPGINDAWIAATAAAYDCPVLSNDHAFQTMSGAYPKLQLLS